MKTNITTRDIQLLELEALIELKKLCDDNGLKFYLRGGSVMGAVKYKGFVPWDDDVDIAVPRKDFEKLIELSQTDWSRKFEIISYHYQEDAGCYFPRVFLKKQFIKEYGVPENNRHGVSVIDILPLDGAPDSNFKQKIYFAHVYFLRIMGSLTTKNLTGHKLHRRILLRFLYLFGIDKKYSQTDIYEKLDRLYSSHSIEDSKFIGTITGSLYTKEIFPKEVWGDGELLDFETEKFLVPTQFDSYLKKLYGDDYLTSEPSDKAKNWKKHIKEVE
ncbi:LicD family protein [Streptococcus loxodontisalivarius]|uniref:Lipopolysaccharide cholinephosphotransferase n=1 Tax=Streptococcus loxodontisalivarius TaxID=1349415 RepID=A0ABS2PQH0_9STRE|nr:LicD family protein [Streptococcus loxodontisalivarius]MBM7641775.1 lipopolysaccharide cholinephosphotransferase [Streptococcus loxodontisalivarius]